MNTSLNEPILSKDGFWSYKKAPKWVKDRFRKAVDYKCQICKKDEKEVGKLVLHRKQRSVKGGLYTVLPLNHPKCNVMVLCKNCHALLHQAEFPHISKYY